MKHKFDACHIKVQYKHSPLKFAENIILLSKCIQIDLQLRQSFWHLEELTTIKHYPANGNQNYLLELNFCGSLFLWIDDSLYFVATNSFSECRRLVFLTGY